MLCRLLDTESLPEGLHGGALSGWQFVLMAGLHHLLQVSDHKIGALRKMHAQFLLRK